VRAARAARRFLLELARRRCRRAFSCQASAGRGGAVSEAADEDFEREAASGLWRPPVRSKTKRESWRVGGRETGDPSSPVSPVCHSAGRNPGTQSDIPGRPGWLWRIASRMTAKASCPTWRSPSVVLAGLCAMKRCQFSNSSLEVREFKFVAIDIKHWSRARLRCMRRARAPSASLSG
jgi:hypothetical protein